MTLTMISAAKKAGTTIGGTNHDARVPELLSLILLGKDLEAPPSSSQRAMAAAWSFASVWGSSLDWVMPFNWGARPPMTRADHEHVGEQAAARGPARCERG